MKPMAWLVPMACALCGCAQQDESHPLPVATVASAAGRDPALDADPALCEYLTRCDPSAFFKEYPGGEEGCFIHLYGTGEGVHPCAVNLAACTSDLASARCPQSADGGSATLAELLASPPASCVSAPACQDP
jgi:hypothetical protein